MIADRFAGRLKQLREQAGMSQKELAQQAGLALSAIGHLEQGLRKPTWETVLALANVLSVTCDAFTDQPEDRPPAAPGRPRKASAGPAPSKAAAKRKSPKRGVKGKKR
jgi:transcriptional regulator with XRE-family HTH domain